MANPQLVDYIKEQLSHGVDTNQLRTLLIGQGWSAVDVEAALSEAYSGRPAQIHKEHHTHYLGITIAVIIILLLGVGLFLLIINKTTPPVEPKIITKPDPLPEPEPLPLPNDLSGWSLCKYEEESIAKDTCYQELNKKEDDFDCDIIEDDEERGFCYRAKETVILEKYLSA